MANDIAASVIAMRFVVGRIERVWCARLLPISAGYCCKTRLISIASLRCDFLRGLLVGSAFVGVLYR